jgi:ribosomal protein L37E
MKYNKVQTQWFKCYRCGHYGPLATDGRCINCGTPP